MKSFTSRLSEQTSKKNSHLCIGLDITPEGLGDSFAPISKLIDHSYKVIDSTIDIVACYKPNLAFFERWGVDGLKWLEKIIDRIGQLDIAFLGMGEDGHTSR